MTEKRHMDWLDAIEKRCIKGMEQPDGEKLCLPPTMEEISKLIAAVRLAECLFTRIAQSTAEDFNYSRAREGRDRLRSGKVGDRDA